VLPGGQKNPAGQNPVPIAVPEPGRQYDPPGQGYGVVFISSLWMYVWTPQRQNIPPGHKFS
jgi:hypothetical protein